MTKLSDEAQAKLQEYLDEVRSALRGCLTVDADDVEHDVMEHIEGELQGMQEPVSRGELEAVLSRLGSPDQWVPEEELTWWRRTVRRLRTGPEDYRLAYISFGVLSIGMLLGTLMRGPASYFFVVFLGSFCLSRAAVSAAGSRGKLGPQKWLICPGLVPVYLYLAYFLLLFPMGLGGALGDNVIWPWYRSLPRSGTGHRLGEVIVNLSVATCALGLWLIALGIVLWRWPKLIVVLFRPFANWFSRKWAKWMMLSGFVLVVATVAVFVLFGIP